MQVFETIREYINAVGNNKELAPMLAEGVITTVGFLYGIGKLFFPDRGLERQLRNNGI